jgi:predicted transposase/invertase (TIGR01784 family)
MQNETQEQTNEKIYNLKNDIIFQTFFARKGNEEFLIDFLNALLKTNIKSIEIREEVNLERLSREEKGGRLDLQATLEDGTIVSIEMQLKNEYNFEERTTLYAGKVISRETERGTDYEDIKQIIMINILGFNMLDVEDYISETAIVLDKHRDYEVLTGIKWYFIELPKFRKQNPDMNEKINQWLAFIDDNNKELIDMAENKNETLKKARIEMNYLTGDAEVRRLAELREKWEMDRVSAINHATRVGMEKGMEKGIIKTAQNLIKMGMPIEQIAKATGLSEEEIEKIKKS